MRGTYQVKGLKNDFKNKVLFHKTDIQVNVTIDAAGATLSVGDLENDIQYNIPFDLILSEILKDKDIKRSMRISK